MTPLTLTYNFGAPKENTPTVPSHGNTITEILPIQLLDIDFNPSVTGLPPEGNTEWQGGQTEILHLQPDFKATSLIINMVKNSSLLYQEKNQSCRSLCRSIYHRFQGLLPSISPVLHYIKLNNWPPFIQWEMGHHEHFIFLISSTVRQC